MSFSGTGQNRASVDSESITEPAVVFEDQMFPGEWRVQWSDNNGEIDPLERGNLKERHKDVYDRLVAQWNEWNQTMLPLDPQSYTGGFTGAQLADHFGVTAPPRPETVGTVRPG